MTLKRVCIHCGRTGFLGFTSCWYGKPGESECLNRTACLNRRYEARHGA